MSHDEREEGGERENRGQLVSSEREGLVLDLRRDSIETHTLVNAREPLINTAFLGHRPNLNGVPRYSLFLSPPLLFWSST